MRLIIQFSKLNHCRYVSHLDLQRMWQRVFRIIGLELEMSQGYNPHPRMRFALPLATGYESTAEVMELMLKSAPDFDAVKATANAVLPAGIRIKSLSAADMQVPKLTALVDALAYDVFLAGAPESEEASQRLLTSPVITYKQKDYNLNSFILNWSLAAGKLKLLVKVDNQLTVRPEVAAAHMFINYQVQGVCRTGIYSAYNGQLPAGIKPYDC